MYIMCLFQCQKRITFEQTCSLSNPPTLLTIDFIKWKLLASQRYNADLWKLERFSIEHLQKLIGSGCRYSFEHLAVYAKCILKLSEPYLLWPVENK